MYFKQEWIRKYSELPKYLRVFIGVDPAFGMSERHDYFACVAVGKDEFNNLFVIESFKGRFTLEDQVQQIIKFYKKNHLPDHPVVNVGIECTAYQEALANQILGATRIPVSKVKPRPQQLKIEEIGSFIMKGKIQFPDDGSCNDLIEMLLICPGGDLFDALDIAIHRSQTYFRRDDLLSKKEPDFAPEAL